MITTADSNAASGRGYVWKYMYTISASETIKFVTNDFIPVKTIGAVVSVDGTGSGGAIGSTATDDGTGQWDVENSAVNGGIHHVSITAGGSGYTDGTYASVPLAGDGSGATCSVIVSSGAVVHVDITAVGSGYKRASINVDGISGIGGGSGGILKPIISPFYGHGADPVQELGGNFVCVNARLEFAEGAGDFPIDNDFRRIGLIQDPFTVGTTTVATATSLAAYSQMTLSSVTGLSVDNLILSATADGTGVAVSRVVSISGLVVSHVPVANSAGGYVDFTSSDSVYVGGSSVGNVNSVNGTFPEVERYSGQIMYVENRGAVTRAADQIEDIKLIIEM